MENNVVSFRFSICLLLPHISKSMYYVSVGKKVLSFQFSIFVIAIHISKSMYPSYAGSNQQAHQGPYQYNSSYPPQVRIRPSLVLGPSIFSAKPMFDLRKTKQNKKQQPVQQQQLQGAPHYGDRSPTRPLQKTPVSNHPSPSPITMYSCLTP